MDGNPAIWLAEQQATWKGLSWIYIAGQILTGNHIAKKIDVDKAELSAVDAKGKCEIAYLVLANYAIGR